MDVGVDNAHFLIQSPCFLPDIVEGALCSAHKPVQAIIKAVALAFPGGALSARDGMHLNDFGIVAVHLCIDTRGKSGYTGADNCNFLFLGRIHKYVGKQKVDLSTVTNPTLRQSRKIPAGYTPP